MGLLQRLPCGIHSQIHTHAIVLKIQFFLCVALQRLLDENVDVIIFILLEPSTRGCSGESVKVPSSSGQRLLSAACSVDFSPKAAGFIEVNKRGHRGLQESVFWKLIDSPPLQLYSI